MKKKDGKLTMNTSTVSNRISKIRSPEVIGHVKYTELYEKFLLLFKAKGFVQSDSFDAKVWFLRDDVFFQSIVGKASLNSSKMNNSFTPTPSSERNRIHEILSEINENADFMNLLVPVETFIYKIVESLLIATNTVERSSKTIDSFQAVKRNLIIKESIGLLEKKIEKLPTSARFQSKMKAKIIKANNFLPGKYDFTMKYFEIKNNNMLQTKIALNNEDSRLIISNSGEIIENRYCSNEFDSIIFNALDNQESLLTKFKSSSNSGSSFSNFCIDSLDLESKKAFLLDIMLNTIDNILDISKVQFKENIELNLNSNAPRNVNYKGSGVNAGESLQKSIILECNFEFDLVTRAAILKRIGSVFTEVIDTKRISEAIIDQILDTYFEEISDSVRYILSKGPEVNKDACCDCIIF